MRGKHPIESFMKKRMDMTQALPPLSTKEFSPPKYFNQRGGNKKMNDLNNYVQNLDMRLYLDSFNQGGGNQPSNMPLSMDQYLVDDPQLQAYYHSDRKALKPLKELNTVRGRDLNKRDFKILQTSLNNNSSIADESSRGNTPLNRTQELKFNQQPSPDKIMIKEEFRAPFPATRDKKGS